MGVPADRIRHATRIVGIGLPRRFRSDPDATDVSNFVVFDQDAVKLRGYFGTDNAKYDAPVVEVIVYAGHVVDQAVSNDEILVRAAVGRCDEDAVAFRANRRLVDELEVLDDPATGITDINGSHSVGIRSDYRAGGFGGAEIGDRDG
jgi:hypothetical protein